MSEVTYGQLDEVLRSLNFSVSEPEKGTRSEPEKGTRVYNHAATGAQLIIATFPKNKKVYPHHIVATRMILEAFGIADPPEFASLLQKAG